MKRRCLALCFIALFALASGCIAEDFPSSEVDNLGSDASDASDAGDAGDTLDGATDVSDTDADPGPETCESEEDCENAGDNQTASCSDAGECVYTCDEGFDDCDGEDSNGCEADLTSASACGSCGATCGGVDDGMHHRPVCEDPETAQCGIDTEACEEGWVDANDDSDDGCECNFESDEDMPDPDGVDANCDGIDGMADRVVYVSRDNGSDNNNGSSSEQAVATITKGVALAKTRGDEESGPFDVVVTEGTYEEYVAVESGVSIYGGYSKDDWSRDLEAHITEIRPAQASSTPDQNRSLIVDQLDADTSLDGLHIYGYTLDGSEADANPGATTYAVWVHSSANHLSIENSQIFAGEGTPGKNGNNGIDGADRNCSAHAGGSGGAQSQDKPCDGASFNSSGGKGQPTTQSAGGGGVGGAHSCANSFGGCSSGNGDPGSRGENGDNGTSGDHPTDRLGQLDGAFWKAGELSPPSDGENGAGGGGGGAGGNCQNNNVLCTTFSDCVDQGGAGGTGGDGGCGATAGENGQSGGASIAVAAIDSEVSFANTTVTLGRGGDGGDGGNGGSGAHGGQPSTGNYGDSSYAGKGGDGAFGGDGGHAGNGAGGCGGPAIGILTSTSASVSGLADDDLISDDAVGGQGGQGGSNGNVNPGPSDCNGEVKPRLNRAD